MSEYKSYVVYPTTRMGRTKSLQDALDEINQKDGAIVSTHVLDDGRMVVIALQGAK